MIDLLALEAIRHELDLQASMVDDYKVKAVIMNNVDKLGMIIMQEQQERYDRTHWAERTGDADTIADSRQHLEG